jgi:hypothetical protein
MPSSSPPNDAPCALSDDLIDATSRFNPSTSSASSAWPRVVAPAPVGVIESFLDAVDFGFAYDDGLATAGAGFSLSFFCRVVAAAGAFAFAAADAVGALNENPAAAGGGAGAGALVDLAAPPSFPAASGSLDAFAALTRRAAAADASAGVSDFRPTPGE